MASPLFLLDRWRHGDSGDKPLFIACDLRKHVAKPVATAWRQMATNVCSVDNLATECAHATTVGVARVCSVETD